MAKKNQPAPKTFEEGMRELESILSEIENGQIGLEESLLRYERGAFLIQHCRGVLKVAQTQIESLSKSPDGSPQLTPLAGEPVEEEAVMVNAGSSDPEGASERGFKVFMILKFHRALA